MDHVDADAGKKRKRSASARSRKRKIATEDEAVSITPDEPVKDESAVIPSAKKVRKMCNYN